MSLKTSKQKNKIEVYEIPIVAYFYSEEDYQNNIDKLENGIAYSNKVYEEARVKFVIIDVIVIEYDYEYDGLREEQVWMAKHDDAISVYSVDEIRLEKEEAHYIGVAYEYGQKRYCAIVYSYIRSDATLTHELGHSLELRHDHENRDNVMHPTIEPIEKHIITQKQIETLRIEARKFLKLNND